MPILDWTRTNLAYEVENGAKALRFEMKAIAAFDLHILQRPGAEAEYSESMKQKAKAYFDASNEEENNSWSTISSQDYREQRKDTQLKTFKKHWIPLKTLMQLNLVKISICS